MEKATDFDSIRANVVNKEYEAGKRFGQIKPEDQIAQWLRVGLFRLENLEKAGQKRPLTAEDIREIDLSGGTDHPDPTLHSMGKLDDWQ